MQNLVPTSPEARGTILYMDAKLAEFQQGRPVDALGKYVQSAFKEAAEHRRSIGVDERMHRALRAVLCEYDPQDQHLLDGIDIYIGLTNTKVRALQSWLTDILSSAEDKPWTLKHTPIPDLSAADREIVVNRLMAEVQKLNLQDMDKVKGVAKELRAAQLKHANKLAKEAARRMETKIEDQLLEGGWRDAFDAFVVDLSIYPAGVIKAPVVKRIKSLRWVDGKAVPHERGVYCVERVSPFDVYPAPNATTPQDGAYMIERKRMTSEQVHSSIGMAGFSEEAIRALLAVYPNGYDQPDLNDAERRKNEGQALGFTVNDSASKLYDVIVYYGQAPGRLLIEHGLLVSDHQKHYETEIWVCGDYVLRCIFNPHPLGRRPFFATSFEKVPGSFWGRDLPDLLRDSQRMVNSSARALARNMAFASGVVGEYDVDRVRDEDDVEHIRPFRMYAVTNDAVVPTAQAALRFHKIDSNATELLRVHEFYEKQADEVSAIPKYVSGSSQVGGAGRTLGGLSLLMGNAAKGVKRVIANIDKQVIEPLVSSLFELNMIFDPDPSIKADAQVIARGSAGILQRELSQARAVEVLQMVTPYAQAGLVPPEGLQVLLRDIIRSLGYTDYDIVPDPERYAQVLQQVQDRLAAGGQVATPPAPDFRAQAGGNEVKLDGRSAVPPAPGAADKIPPSA